MSVPNTYLYIDVCAYYLLTTYLYIDVCAYYLTMLKVRSHRVYYAALYAVDLAI